MLRTRKVLVITNDAGGAEIISAYVKANASKYNFVCYVSGPARKIFTRKKLQAKTLHGGNSEVSHVVERHRDTSSVLLGTGWMTTIEREALKQAKLMGLKTIVYLESWSNYRERFGYPLRGWRSNLPDEIWVGDEYAQTLAKKYFPHTQVRLVHNQYFLDIRRRYQLLKKSFRGKKGVLFLSDAVRGNEKTLRFVMKLLSDNNTQESLRIRLHPADSPTRYDKLVDEFGNKLSVTISKEKDIVRDLLRARIVVGTETVAMVGAVICDIRTICVVSKNAKPQLPYPEIIRVKNLQRFKNLI